MVDKNNNQEHDEIEITSEAAETQDETDMIETEATAAQKIKTLQAKLKEAEAAKQDALEQLHRSKADYLNARKRIEEESVGTQKRIKQSFIESLLPLCDSFAVAMQDQAVWEQVDEQWRKGVEGIHSQLQSILATHNVKSFQPTGENFDPNRHEALAEEPVEDSSKHNTVTNVVQSGYYFDDEDKTLIRPARVMVGVSETDASA